MRSNALATFGLPSLLLLFAMGWSIGLFAVHGAGAPGQLSLAVFPPWWSEKQVFSAAANSGSAVVAYGQRPWLLVVAPQTDEQSHGLKAQGALLVLNAVAAKACSTTATASREAADP